MINKLPEEVLNLIFRLLPLVQKQECMYVCHQWKRIIQTRCWLSELKLTEWRESPVHEVLQFAKMNPHLAKQVELLEIRSYMDEERLRFFPHLKSIQTIIESPRVNEEELEESPDAFKEIRPLKAPTLRPNQITRVEDTGRLHLTRLLLASDLCYGLVTLKLGRYGERSGEISDTFLKLKNMPVLKHLSLEYHVLSVDLLDSIHANVPSIKELNLYEIFITDFRLDRKYTPVPSVTQVSFTPDSENSYEDEWKITNFNWITYANKTYPNLKHFEIAQEPHRWDPDQVRRLYIDNLSDLAHDLGSQLSSFTLYCAFDVQHQVLQALDDADCRLDALRVRLLDQKNFINALGDSDQANYITKLDLFEVWDDTNFMGLKNMKKLKSLKISFYIDPEIFERMLGSVYAHPKDIEVRDLVKLFDCFPESLESIHIQEVQLKYNSKTLKGLQFPQLKRIVFERTEHTMKSRLDEFITERVPNLTTLELEGVNFKEETFLLPNHHFEHLEVTTFNFGLGQSGIRLITQDYYKPRFFLRRDFQNRGYSRVSDWILPSTKMVNDKAPCVTVVCASVKELIVDRWWAYLIKEEEKYQSLTWGECPDIIPIKE